MLQERLWIIPVKNGKNIVDYKLYINYKSEVANPNDEPDTQEREGIEKSNEQYAKMELPCQRTLQ